MELWDTDYNIFARGSNRQENSSIDTMAAMVIGIGIGIAAWEMMKRKNAKGSSR